MTLFNLDSMPKCEKCGNQGLVMVHSVLLCGTCTIEWNNKQLIKKREEILS